MRNTPSRRTFLLGSAALVAAPAVLRGAPAAGVADPGFRPDAEIDLFARPGEAQILSGAPTKLWRYFAEVASGDKDVATPMADGFLGPLLRFRQGQKIRIRLHNELPEKTITHWHGLHVPMAADGHPVYAIDPGQSFTYEFEVKNRAGLHFYHPHTHEATATQVYRGLAGGILVTDAEEAALGLPSGEFELPLVLQDRAFNGDNQVVYGGGMHLSMFGFYGDHILVNGRPDRVFEVASRAYRLRILNGSNARIFKLGFDDGSPLTLLGVDGGLLEAPQQRPYLMLAPGERLDVWVDFSGRPVGARVELRSLPYSGAVSPMAQRMMGVSDMIAPPGGAYRIATFAVTRAVGDSPSLPKTLAKWTHRKREDAANSDDPAPIAISEAPMRMLLNGAPYGDDIGPRERFPMGSLQLMKIFHDHGGGMGMGGMRGGMGMGGMGMGMGGMGGGMMGFAMMHPVHLHGQQFEVIAQSFDGDGGDYATIREGLVYDGLKDTVLVPPGQRLDILKPFEDFKGRFMYHCHILEHEDMGMMRQFEVV